MGKQFSAASLYSGDFYHLLEEIPEDTHNTTQVRVGFSLSRGTGVNEAFGL